MENLELRVMTSGVGKNFNSLGDVETLERITLPRNECFEFARSINPKDTFKLPGSENEYMLACSPIRIIDVETNKSKRIDLLVKMPHSKKK